MRKRFERVYAVLCPGDHPRFVTGWFMAKLREAGVQKHRVTVSRWINGQSDMPNEAWLLLTSLEAQAREVLRRQELDIG